MTERIRWGILSTGRIAHTFATALKTLDDAEVVAVGSRTREAAERFGETFGIPHRHASYEALAADPDVDVIYVATPHPLHYDNARMCLEAGKAVLCEKPFTINAVEAADLIALAQRRGLFLMEAMWTRFLPAMAEVRRLVQDGMLGDVRAVAADMGFRADFDPGSRLFAPELGGGALLDVGVYTISFASMVLGAPDRVAAMAHLGRTGVDELSGLLLGYAGGALATLMCGVVLEMPGEATIMGTRGRIRIHANWWRAERLSVWRDGRMELIERPVEGNGYQYQALEVMRCLREGRIESEIMPLQESLEVMQVMDRAREQWGLRYPSEM